MLDLAIVLCVYGGLRTYEKYHKNTHLSKSEQTLLKKNSSPKKTSPLILGDLTDDKEKQRDLHYVKASAIAIGLGILRNSNPAFALLNLTVFTYAAIPYLRQVETSLLVDKKIDGYVLYGVADFMTLGLNRYATAALGVGLVHTAKLVISNAQDKSKKMLIDVFSRQPQEAYILKEGKEIKVALENLQEGDIVIVTTGQIVPADGTIIHGVATIDQHTLTGESQPAEKEVGHLVFASTILITGYIHIRVSKSGQETTIAKISQILNDSINFKTRSQLRGEQWADRWNVPILGLAFLSWPIIGPIGTVSVLNGHIAQTIRIAAPLGTLNHLNIASHKGILVKNGQALEGLGKIDTLIFDKTGTLTSEQPKVGKIVISPSSSYSENELLAWAAAAERKLAHPIARAIVKEAEQRCLLLPEIDDSQFHIGYGITFKADELTIRVGSHRFMELEHINIPVALQQALQYSHSDGHSIILLAVGEQVEGAFEMHATVRPEVKKVIQQLRQRGLKYLAIVSGDHENPTKRLAKELGMDSYYFDVLPENKAKIVEELKHQQRSVCFIGDGVNDTIAMKAADISISLSGATSIATDVAQIVLMDGSLKHIVDLFEISDDLEQNLQYSLAINLIAGATTVVSAYVFRIDILMAMFISQTGLLTGIGNAMWPLWRFEMEGEVFNKAKREQHLEQLKGTLEYA